MANQPRGAGNKGIPERGRQASRQDNGIVTTGHQAPVINNLPVNRGKPPAHGSGGKPPERKG